MAFLRNVTASLWDYVSPRKTQQKREKPFNFKKPALPTRMAAARSTTLHKQIMTPVMREMSPDSRVKNWDPRTPSPQSDIDATLLPPSPPTSALLSREDFEGDTLLPESPSPLDRDETGSSADEWNANEDTTVVDDGTYMVKHNKHAVGDERRRRDQQGRELRDAGWSEDAVFLFQKLGMRGFEPILPISWIDDFESLPEDLFTANFDKAFLKPAYGTDHRAQRALDHLVDLGGLARDAWFTRAQQRTPAYQIAKAVKKYTKWAMKDGQVDRIWSQLPLFETVTFGRHVHSSVGEAQMIAKLGKLHDRWHEAFQNEAAKDDMASVLPEVPTLYGVTASHTVMAFVSYAPPTEDNEKGSLRLIAMFDFGKEDFDVWNSLAIAIFVTHCRNRMMQLQEFLSEPELSTEGDPDL